MMNTYSDNQSEINSNLLQCNLPVQQKIFRQTVHLPDNRPRSVIQKKLVDGIAVSKTAGKITQLKVNGTGLSSHLNPGAKKDSGNTGGEMKIHYNSSQPVQLNAQLGRRQQEHAPHHAWQPIPKGYVGVGALMQLKENANLNNHAAPDNNEANWYIPTPGKTIESNASFTKVIQRKIIVKAGNFAVKGRAGAHNTGAIKTALKELMQDRFINANPALRHENNEFETAAVKAGKVKGLGLHIAHHVSDSVIQNDIVEAAKKYNAAPAANPALWNTVEAYIKGTEPPIFWKVPAIMNFYNTSLNTFNTAKFALAGVTAVHPIPVNLAWAGTLTLLANSIANNPMNLHYGKGGTNSSLGHHGDPNSFAHIHPGLPLHKLQRQMSWRSNNMRATLNAAGINPAQHDRTLAMALVMPAITLANKQAKAYKGIIPAPLVKPHLYTHTSGNPNNFANLI